MIIREKSFLRLIVLGFNYFSNPEIHFDKFIKQYRAMRNSFISVLNRWSLKFKMVILVSAGAAGLTVLALLGSWIAYDLSNLARKALLRQGICEEVGACFEAIDLAIANGMIIMLMTSAIFASILAPLFAIVTSTVVGRAKSAQEAASIISNNVLSKEVEVEGSDEIGMLLSSLSDMRFSLLNTIREVRVCSQSLAEDSEEIAGGANDFSSRSALQANALQEATKTLHAVTETIRGNAVSASAASLMAQRTRELADQGAEEVGRVITAMSEIQAHSQRMSEVLTVIDGIAFQTKILSLNAAIEAASAGDQGRGFAVVAGEVRGLAQRSADSAAEIRTLIAGSVEEIERGSNTVISTGERIERIVHAVGEVANLIASISESSNEQSSSLFEVSQAVRVMDVVTQKNSALIEESATATTRLSQGAIKLRDLVARFQLESTDAPPQFGVIPR